MRKREPTTRNHVPLVLGFLLLLTATSATAQEPTLVLENARVIVGDGTVLDRGSVVVAGERIVSVTEEPVQAPGARRIDASGNTVLPGLVDAHVHLLVGDMSSMSRSESDLDAYVRGELPTRLRAYLEAGITTVMSASAHASANAAQASGRLLGLPLLFEALGEPVERPAVLAKLEEALPVRLLRLGRPIGFEEARPRDQRMG